MDKETTNESAVQIPLYFLFFLCSTGLIGLKNQTFKQQFIHITSKYHLAQFMWNKKNVQILKKHRQFYLISLRLTLQCALARFWSHLTYISNSFARLTCSLNGNMAQQQTYSAGSFQQTNQIHFESDFELPSFYTLYLISF